LVSLYNEFILAYNNRPAEKSDEEEKGAKLTMSQWKALKGNENKTSQEYRTYFNN
jgi:hypothetical protein